MKYFKLTGNAQGEEEMKKMILMVTMLMMATVLLAVGKVAYKDGIVELSRLVFVEKNYVAAQAYLDDMDFTTDDDSKYGYVTYQSAINRGNKKLPVTADATIAYTFALATKIGLTNKQLIERQTLKNLWRAEIPNYEQAGYDYYKSIAVPSDTTKRLAVNFCTALKKYEEALSLHIAVGNYDGASYIAAINMKNKVLTFEYCRKAILDSGFRTAKELTILLDRVNSFDYAGTTVTQAMLLDLATATNRKYSNFLVKDKAAWEPVITGLRTTIEEMKKDVK